MVLMHPFNSHRDGKWLKCIWKSLHMEIAKLIVLTRHWKPAKAVGKQTAKYVHRASMNDRLKCMWVWGNRWSGISGINTASGLWSVTAIYFIFPMEKHRGTHCLESFVFYTLEDVKMDRSEPSFCDLKILNRVHEFLVVLFLYYC